MKRQLLLPLLLIMDVIHKNDFYYFQMSSSENIMSDEKKFHPFYRYDTILDRVKKNSNDNLFLYYIIKDIIKDIIECKNQAIYNPLKFHKLFTKTLYDKSVKCTFKERITNLLKLLLSPELLDNESNLNFLFKFNLDKMKTHFTKFKNGKDPIVRYLDIVITMGLFCDFNFNNNILILIKWGLLRPKVRNIIEKDSSLFSKEQWTVIWQFSSYTYRLDDKLDLCIKNNNRSSYIIADIFTSSEDLQLGLALHFHLLGKIEYDYYNKTGNYIIDSWFEYNKKYPENKLTVPREWLGRTSKEDRIVKGLPLIREPVELNYILWHQRSNLIKQAIMESGIKIKLCYYKVYTDFLNPFENRLAKEIKTITEEWSDKRNLLKSKISECFIYGISDIITSFIILSPEETFIYTDIKNE